MYVLSRRRNRRRIVSAAMFVVVLGAAGVLWWQRDETPAQPPVPTVAVVNTAVDIGCVDEAGAETAAAKYWYSYKAAGGLNLDGEITASLRLGDFAAITFDAVVAQFGSYRTTAIRDVAPDPAFCPTDRVAEVTLLDDTEIVVIAWRSVAAASPQWIPSETPFVAVDDTTFVSEGDHVVAVLKVAPDGTSVVVTAYGTNARKAFAKATGPIVETTVAPQMGTVTATVAQLTPIADAVLAFSIAR